MHIYKPILRAAEVLAAYAGLSFFISCDMPTAPSAVKNEVLPQLVVGLPVCFKDTLVKNSDGVDLIFYPIQEKADSFYVSVKWGNDATPQKYALKNNTEIMIPHTGCVSSASGSIKRPNELNESEFKSNLEDICE